MIAVIDYQAGNIRSVTKALQHLGAETIVSDDPDQLNRADKIILPGVGAFGYAVNALTSRGIFSFLEKAIMKGIPFLGICLGFQLLLEDSEESPGAKGLALFKGKVKRYPRHVKIPHLGWNQVHQTKDHPLWKDIPDNAYYYYANSYYVHPEEPVEIGRSHYGLAFTAAARKENCFGIQFHPEKSQRAGLKLLHNFIAL